MKKTVFKTFAVIMALVLVILSFAGCGGDYERSDDTVFTVLQITDVHIVNDEKKDAKAFKTIDAMLEETNPDMIVVTGDITSEHDNLTAIKKFCEYIEPKKIPWAFTFGNHDAEGAVSKEEISDYLETLEYCIYERGDETKVVPSLAFFHIPLYEFTQAYNEAKENGEIISGWRFEKEYGPYEDDGMFEAMLEMGSTKGVFVGHDHMNNYSVNYKGIRFTYGNSCDHNIYLVPFRGGKLIEIKKNGSFTVAPVVRHRLTSSAVVGKAE